jgi:hypothetical protein
MLSTMLRSRTARCSGALIGALALAAALPATASADRDGRGWRNERHDDGGRGHGDRHWSGRGHGHFRGGYRYAYAPHRHGPACSHRPAYRYGRAHHPYAAFYRHGWFFGR